MTNFLKYFNTNLKESICIKIDLNHIKIDFSDKFLIKKNNNKIK